MEFVHDEDGVSVDLTTEEAEDLLLWILSKKHGNESRELSRGLYAAVGNTESFHRKRYSGTREWKNDNGSSPNAR